MSEKIKVSLPRPNEEEALEIINRHKHHLVELRKGTIRTPLGLMEGEDLYCHTCKEWLGVSTKLKFESKPRRVGKKAVWVEGRPDDLNLIAKTYGLSEKEKRLLKLQEEDPEAFNILMETWKEEAFLKDLKKLMKKYGFSKDKVIELLSWLRPSSERAPLKCERR